MCKRIPGDFRSFVYCTAIRNGDDKEWEFASIQYDKTENPREKENLQYGMSCTKQTWLISRFLNDQINETKVRLQDSYKGISYIANKPQGNLITWVFIKDNWDRFLNKYIINS